VPLAAAERARGAGWTVGLRAHLSLPSAYQSARKVSLAFRSSLPSGASRRFGVAPSVGRPTHLILGATIGRGQPIDFILQGLRCLTQLDSLADAHLGHLPFLRC
jgi:hypothetical protein